MLRNKPSSDRKHSHTPLHMWKISQIARQKQQQQENANLFFIYKHRNQQMGEGDKK